MEGDIGAEREEETRLNLTETSEPFASTFQKAIVGAETGDEAIDDGE